MSPRSAEVQVSVCTIWISWPTNFVANDGIPVAAWTWSIRTRMPWPSGSTSMEERSTRWWSHTSWRNAGSASIAATSASGAS